MAEIKKHKILVVDDNEAIHEDFRKIFSLLTKSTSDVQDQASFILSGAAAAHPAAKKSSYIFDFAHQGQEAVEKVKKSMEGGEPYCLAFVDMRMPPGWNGMKTIEEMWKVDARIEMVICTAYSDQNWEEIQDTLGMSDKLLILKKPFEPIEVLQHAIAACSKWDLERALFLAQINQTF